MPEQLLLQLSEMTELREWLFGYGTLMNMHSRNSTVNTFDAIPVRIIGYRRKWDILTHGVGIIHTDQSTDTVNGVLTRLSPTSIIEFDTREIPWGFKRISLSIHQCHILTEFLDDHDKDTAILPKIGDIIWTYGKGAKTPKILQPHTYITYGGLYIYTDTPTYIYYEVHLPLPFY